MIPDPLQLIQSGPTVVLGVNTHLPELPLPRLRKHVSALIKEDTKVLVFDLTGVTAVPKSCCNFISHFAGIPRIQVQIHNLKDDLIEANRGRFDARVVFGEGDASTATRSPAFPYFELAQHKQAEVIRFTSATVQDSGAIRQIALDLGTVLRQSDKKLVIIDLSTVMQLGSAALATLAGFDKNAKSAGVVLVICGLNDVVSEVVSTVGLDKLLTFEPTVPAALKHAK